MTSVSEMSPAEWLAYQRKRHGYGSFDLPIQLIEQYIARLPPQNQGEALNIWKARYGVSIGAIEDAQMQEYLQHLKPVLNEAEAEAAGGTYFGIYPTGEFNGYVDYTPKGDRILILHEGLPCTLHYWSSLFVRSLEDGSDTAVSRDPATCMAAFSWIARIWYPKVKCSPSIPDVFPKTEDSWGLAQVLTFSSILFVLGHEIGHLVLKHGSYINDAARNHKEEFDADLVGLKIIIRYALLRGLNFDDSYYTKFMLFAPYLVLAAISTLGDTDSETHPSATRRFKRIEASYQKQIRGLLGKNAYKAFLAEFDNDIMKRLSDIGTVLMGRHSVYRQIIAEHVLSPTKP
jgi:hypothetical protein